MKTQNQFNQKLLMLNLLMVVAATFSDCDKWYSNTIDAQSETTETADPRVPVVDAEKHDRAEGYALRRRYLSGDGVEQNAAGATHWIQKAAGQAILVPQSDLGDMYWAREGVVKAKTKSPGFSSPPQTKANHANGLT